VQGESEGGGREDDTGATGLMTSPAGPEPHTEDPPLFRARVAAPIAPMHEEPRVASQQVSQQLAGHGVDAMDMEGDWVRARGEDGYEGWIHTGFLERKAPPGESGRLISLGCVTECGGKARRTLPLRAFLREDERVLDGDAVSPAEIRRAYPLDPAAIAMSARELFRGTSYIWGGVTPWGADCSGLVQSSFALHGRVLPRDAWQQAELGTKVEGDFGALCAGDLLFFTDRADRRITHVGISLGSSEMVHLALGRGGYAHENLLSDESYIVRLRERFLFAKRLL
jgi:gamma-D-glutamyl-L-lysine dipeptidyl-peptidase